MDVITYSMLNFNFPGKKLKIKKTKNCNLTLSNLLAAIFSRQVSIPTHTRNHNGSAYRMQECPVV